MVCSYLPWEMAEASDSTLGAPWAWEGYASNLCSRLCSNSNEFLTGQITTNTPLSLLLELCVCGGEVELVSRHDWVCMAEQQLRGFNAFHEYLKCVNTKGRKQLYSVDPRGIIELMGWN